MRLSHVVYIISLVICITGVNVTERELDWQSMVFIIPDPNGNQSGRKCAQLSSNFCYHGLLVESNQRDYRWDSRAHEVFRILAWRSFKSFNWFSLQDSELGSCCESQSSLYLKQGRDRGMSPMEYFAKSTDFSLSREKRLNYVSVRFDQWCGNIISAIGFGPGPFRYHAEDSRVTEGRHHIFPIPRQAAQFTNYTEPSYARVKQSDEN
ncbi:uncharacterized protein LOC134852079 [Symsagittifera roscoffensis]|uniref:uncharacterized protein LOC134852079 n=1 Tax=Symsagittifera roscoffensis TaxID=84072 RepID=UPI00307B6E96